MSADEVGACFKSGDYLGRVHKDGNALAAEAFEGMTLYTDHREMLAAENLDIVTVGVSDHRHADIVVNAANTPGVKGIFCPPNPHHPHPPQAIHHHAGNLTARTFAGEKPLATTVEDTDRMLAACEANGVILSVDHTRRFLPIWRYCKEQLVDKGEIGEIQARAALLTPLTLPTPPFHRSAAL